MPVKLFSLRHLALAIWVLCLAPGFAQPQSADPFWRRLAARPANVAPAQQWVNPQEFSAVALDHAALRARLALAPSESAGAKGATAAPTEITLPLPDGTLQRFAVVESPVMAAELAALFPEIKTYYAQSIDDPVATARLDLTPAGFHAQILSPNGAVYIDPHLRDASVYAVYHKKDYRRSVADFHCATPQGQTVNLLSAETTANRSGANLRTYRLACAADGEYTAFHGGNVSGGMAGIVSAVNRVNGVYETELAIRLVLVANNQLLVYTNAATDPYTDSDGAAMLDENQATVDSIIGSANYDIGHVFSTGGGGIAGLGVVCINGQKANGVTGNTAPTGDSFWIDYVAHEMGHQFGGNHTFNSTTGSCGGGNRNASTAYEPGSGTTIMAYAGICGSDDVQPHSDPYFHSVSFDEIIAYSTTGSGSGCPVSTSTGNAAPTVSAGANYNIPAATPFTLTATGSDANGDTLTYCWEQRDLGAATTLTAADNGSSPIFRSFNPTTNTTRTFPRLVDLLANTNSLGEKLPTTTRTLRFRVTVRDNRAGGGGVNTADMQVSVTNTGSAFALTSPNGGGTFSNAIVVTWNVARTTNAPINAANVKISLSTDGGLTFPAVLLASTPNDGSELVTLPALNTATARIKVEAIGNIFFDLSNTNFTIVPGVPTPLVALDAATLLVEGCPNTNLVADPGETVTYQISLRNVGSAPTTNLTATLLAIGGVTTPSGAQNYGALPAGGAASGQPFTFTVNGTCGSTITATFHLQDGTADLGNVSQIIPLGETATVWSENFDSVAPPALPVGWSSTGGGSQTPWTTVTTQRDTLPNAAYTISGASVGSNELVSAAVTLLVGASQLTFRHRYEMESTYDGGVLELKIGGGAFADILTAGGSFASGGYVATLTSGSSLAGRSAWTGTNSSFITVTVNLPPAAAGQTVQFRWRSATDSSVSSAGWWVDTVAVVGSVCCTGPVAPSITAQPQSQAVVTGQPANFTVGTSGTAPISYQWYFNSNSIVGATGTNHFIASVQVGDVGGYSVVLSNAVGVVTSSVATLIIGTSPTITTNPVSLVIGAGNAFNFAAAAAGTAPLAYQWRLNGANLSGAAANSFGRIAAQFSDTGSYTLVVTNLFGGITSAPATLVVTGTFAGTLAGWDVSAQTDYGDSPLVPSTNAPSITVSGLTRGTGVTLTGPAAGGAWGGNGFNQSSAAAAITANDFATFALAPAAGCKASFSSISKFDYRRSSAGPPSGIIQFQIGAGAFSDITNVTYVTGSSGVSLAAINLSGITALQNVGAGTNVTFRIVNYSASNAGGSWYIYDKAGSTAPDLAIDGTVTSVYVPPAIPPEFAAVGLTNNELAFTIIGTPGANYIIQFTTNLVAPNWLPLQTNPAPFHFIATNALPAPAGFYRALLAP